MACSSLYSAGKICWELLLSLFYENDDEESRMVFSTEKLSSYLFLKDFRKDSSSIEFSVSQLFLALSEFSRELSCLRDVGSSLSLEPDEFSILRMSGLLQCLRSVLGCCSISSFNYWSDMFILRISSKKSALSSGGSDSMPEFFLSRALWSPFDSESMSELQSIFTFQWIHLNAPPVGQRINLQISQLSVLSRIVGGNVEGPERRTLGDTHSIVGVLVVILQVSALLRIEDLPGPCVLVFDSGDGTDLPEILGDGLKELVLLNRQAQVLAVLLEDFLVDGVGSAVAVQVLDHQDGLLDFIPDLVVVFAPSLDVRVASEVEPRSHFAESRVLFIDFDSMPQPRNDRLPVLRSLTFEGPDNLLEVHQAILLAVKYFEDLRGFDLSYVYFLLFYHLLELVQVHPAVVVCIISFQEFFKLQEATSAFRGEGFLHSQQHHINLFDFGHINLVLLRLELGLQPSRLR